MSASIERFIGLLDGIKSRRRGPADSSSPVAIERPPDPGFFRPRVALPPNADAGLVRRDQVQTLSAAGVPPIEAPPLPLPRDWDAPSIPGVHTDHWGTGAVKEGGAARLPAMIESPQMPLGGNVPGALRPPLSPPAVVDVTPTMAVDDPGIIAPVQARPRIAFSTEGESAGEAAGGAIQHPEQRPRIVDPTGYSVERLKQMELAPAPNDRNGKLKSILIGMGRGFQRGGLGGLVSGGIYGGVKDDWDEREGQAEDLERQRARVGRLFGLDKTQGDLKRQEAQTRKAMLPPPIEYDHLVTDQGFVYVPKHDPGNVAGRVVTGLKPPTKPEAQPSYTYQANERGEIVGINTRNPRDVVGTGVIKPDDKVDWPLSDGRKVRISAAAAAQADATLGREGRDSADRYARDSYEDEQRQGERDAQNYDRLRGIFGKAAGAVEDFEEAKRAAIAAAKEKGANVAADFTQAQIILNNIRSLYPEAVEDAGMKDGYPYVRLRGLPLPPQINAPRRPAPQPVPRPQARTSAPRSLPRPAPVTANSFSSEAEVRAAAVNRGKDPEAAAAKWRRLRGQ